MSQQHVPQSSQGGGGGGGATQLNPTTRAWLDSILQRYQNKARTLSDSESLLLSHRGLSPKTDYYTSDQGVQELLLTIFGVVPITWRGGHYNIPLAIWIPLSYPLEAPYIFVTPTPSMYIKPGRFVDLSGRIMHPMLSFWDSNISLLELIRRLCTEFSIEPPVASKVSPSTSPSRTSLINDTGGGAAASSSGSRTPSQQNAMLPRPTLPSASLNQQPPPIPSKNSPQLQGLSQNNLHQDNLPPPIQRTYQSEQQQQQYQYSTTPPLPPPSFRPSLNSSPNPPSPTRYNNSNPSQQQKQLPPPTPQKQHSSMVLPGGGQPILPPPLPASANPIQNQAGGSSANMLPPPNFPVSLGGVNGAPSFGSLFQPNPYSNNQVANGPPDIGRFGQQQQQQQQQNQRQQQQLSSSPTKLPQNLPPPLIPSSNSNVSAGGAGATQPQLPARSIPTNYQQQQPITPTSSSLHQPSSHQQHQQNQQLPPPKSMALPLPQQPKVENAAALKAAQAIAAATLLQQQQEQKERDHQRQEEAALHSLRLAVTQKINTYLAGHRQSHPHEIGRLRQISRHLSANSHLAEEVLEHLKQFIVIAEKNIETSNAKIQELRASVARLKSRPPFDVELHVTAHSVLEGQLVDVVADMYALQDTLYYVSKGFGSSGRAGSSKCTAEGYIKHVRSLARDIFMKKALAAKITATIHIAKERR